MNHITALESAAAALDFCTYEHANWPTADKATALARAEAQFDLFSKVATVVGIQCELEALKYEYPCAATTHAIAQVQVAFDAAFKALGTAKTPLVAHIYNAPRKHHQLILTTGPEIHNEMVLIRLIFPTRTAAKAAAKSVAAKPHNY